MFGAVLGHHMITKFPVRLSCGETREALIDQPKIEQQMLVEANAEMDVPVCCVRTPKSALFISNLGVITSPVSESSSNLNMLPPALVTELWVEILRNIARPSATAPPPIPTLDIKLSVSTTDDCRDHAVTKFFPERMEAFRKPLALPLTSLRNDDAPAGLQYTDPRGTSGADPTSEVVDVRRGPAPTPPTTNPRAIVVDAGASSPTPPPNTPAVPPPSSPDVSNKPVDETDVCRPTVRVALCVPTAGVLVTARG